MDNSVPDISLVLNEQSLTLTSSHVFAFAFFLLVTVADGQLNTKASMKLWNVWSAIGIIAFVSISIFFLFVYFCPQLLQIHLTMEASAR